MRLQEDSHAGLNLLYNSIFQLTGERYRYVAFVDTFVDTVL